MKDQPMPEAIRGLFNEDLTSQSSSEIRDQFVKNFDTRSNAIIYHGHEETKDHDKKLKEVITHD